jgi:hypothetical protein
MARNRTSNGLLTPASIALVAMAWVNVGSLHAEDFKTLKGHSEIKRSAPKGSYNFVESVEGDARVMIRNAAKVDFYTSPTWAFHDGSKIDGDAKVGKVVFKQKIDGHAKVFWCTAAVGDPRPDPRPAAVNGTATFEEVSLEQMNSMIREHMPKD